MTAPGKQKKKLSLMAKILIGFALGIVAGLVFSEQILWVKPIGDLFIRGLRMMVVPLIFSSLVVGVASLNDINKMGRIGGRTILLVLITTACSTCIGMFLAITMQPGAGMEAPAAMPGAVKVASTSFATTLVNMVPINPIESMAQGSVLQVIVFAVILGIAIVIAGDRAKPLYNMLEGLAEAMYKVVDIVFIIAPYGVFALIACVVGTHGSAVLFPMLKLIVCVYLGCIITLIFINGLFTVGLLGKCNVWTFFKHFAPAMLFSFVTASSAATLPVSMRCAQQGMGVSKRVSSFVQPLGATINMNGTSLYQGICAIFVAQMMGLDLTLMELGIIVFTAVLAAVGTAGVPGAGLVMLTMVLTSIGLPVESVAIVAGVDRLLDAARCVPNVTGDAAMALAIARGEGELDKDVFDGKKEWVDEELHQADKLNMA